MRLTSGYNIYYSYVNLKGIDSQYRHPTIRFVVIDPERAQDTDDEMYGHVIMQFEYQSNGYDPSNDWYGGSIGGLVSICNYYEIRDVNQILRAWERYLKGSWTGTHKRAILKFLKSKKIKRVVLNREAFNQWKLYR